jgi:hypothetical protein
MSGQNAPERPLHVRLGGPDPLISGAGALLVAGAVPGLEDLLGSTVDVDIPEDRPVNLLTEEGLVIATTSLLGHAAVLRFSAGIESFYLTINGVLIEIFLPG